MQIFIFEKFRCGRGHSRAASLDLRNGSQDHSKPSSIRPERNIKFFHTEINLEIRFNNFIKIF